MFSAYWYAPGQPRIAIELVICPEGLGFERQIWPYAELNFEWAGAETGLIEIHYQDQLLYCSELILLEDLARYLNPMQYQQTQAIIKKARPGRKWKGWATILLALVLTSVAMVWGALLALVWARDFTLSYIPVEIEDSLAESTWKEMLNTSPVCQSPLLQDTVDKIDLILSQAIQSSKYDLRYQVLKSNQVNALALPGGRIAIHAKLIAEAPSALALAGVMAHEAEHVLQRHGLKSMVNHLGIGIMVPVLLGDMGSIAVSLGAAGAGLLNLNFSRSQEQEADLKGVRLMQSTQLDPVGMAVFFEWLQAHEKQQALAGLQIPAFLSTHPLSASRLQDVNAAIAASPTIKYPAIAIDWPQVQAAAKDCLTQE